MMYCDKCENFLEALSAENEKLQNRIEELEDLIADLEVQLSESLDCEALGADIF